MSAAIRIEISNRQSSLAIDSAHATQAVREVLVGEGVDRGTVSVAIVDDPTIHQLNRQYLQHDDATDVLSFLLESQPMEGEIIVSGQTASRNAEQYGWTAADELTLYLIHGALHLVGYDDRAECDLREMRRLEAHYLQRLGIEQTAGADGPASKTGVRSA